MVLIGKKKGLIWDCKEKEREIFMLFRATMNIEQYP